MTQLLYKCVTLFFALHLTSLVATAQRLLIEGRYKGADGTTIYLKQYTDRNFIIVDSARTVHGRFFFNREVNDILAYGITSSKRAQQPPILFAGADTLRLQLDDTTGTLTIEKSPLNDLYKTLLSQIEQENFSIVKLSQELPTSPLVPFFVMRDLAWKLSLEDLRAIKSNLDSTLMYNLYYQQFERLLAAQEGLQIGCIAPNFQLRNTNGQLVQLTDFHGQPIVLSFWASWCGDCRREIPSLVAAYERLKDKGVQFVSVSMDTSFQNWQKAVKRYKMTWPQLSDLQGWDSSVVPPYALRWVPTTYILDAEGRILSVNYNEQELAVALNTFFH